MPIVIIALIILGIAVIALGFTVFKINRTLANHEKQFEIMRDTSPGRMNS